MTLDEFLDAFGAFREAANRRLGGVQDSAIADLFRVWLAVQEQDGPALATEKQVKLIWALIRAGFLDALPVDPSALTRQRASELIEVGTKRRAGLGFKTQENQTREEQDGN